MTDTERLDWLEKYMTEVNSSRRREECVELNYVSPRTKGARVVEGRTLRQAIDAAVEMSGQ